MRYFFVIFAHCALLSSMKSKQSRRHLSVFFLLQPLYNLTTTLDFFIEQNLSLKIHYAFPKNQKKAKSSHLNSRSLFQVRYTGHRDLPMTERRVKFETEIQDGFAEIAISSTGLTLVLTWNWKKSKSYGCEFVKEPGKVNGVKY